MVYNNFFIRLLISCFFIFIYFIFTYLNFDYVYYLILLIYILILIEIYLYFKIYKFIPFFYLLISFIFFINIDFDKIILLDFNLFILIVISFDIFSYLIGKTFGKNNFSKISPNKTYEGLIGGILSSFFFVLIFAFIFKITLNKEFVFYVLLIILSAFVGDIIESFFKRKNDLKNSSEFIPGHGGVFDRFDSFLFSIIIYSVSNNIYQ
tara:strand:- start:4779 stop:5402 length:624 start_codon:yes stop_codon:yes gene_type:complete